MYEVLFIKINAVYLYFKYNEMTVLTRKEYCDKYGMHPNTLRNRIEKGSLPSFHQVKHLDGRGVVIIIDQCQLCADVESACIEYNKRCGRTVRPDIAAELSIKYGINTAKLFRVLGI